MFYTARRTLFTGTETFTLKENKLFISSTKKNQLVRTIPYSAIKEVSLTYFPGYRNTPEIYQCFIKATNKETIKISSNHYKSFGYTVPQNDEYAAFVNALHQKLETNSSIVFKKGTSNVKFRLLTIFFGILILALIVLGIIGIFMKKYNVALAMLFGAFSFGAISYKIVKSFKPEKYSPTKIPTTLIPSF